MQYSCVTHRRGGTDGRRKEKSSETDRSFLYPSLDILIEYYYERSVETFVVFEKNEQQGMKFLVHRCNIFNAFVDEGKWRDHL